MSLEIPGYGFTLVWLLVALPGFAALRRAGGVWLDRGVFAAVSASYLASFLLLTPFSILGYAVGAPIDMLVGAIVGLVVLSLLDLARGIKGWRFPRRPSWLGLFTAAVVLVDVVASHRVGSYQGGDAHYHVARIRSLVDHGFNSWDPFVPGHVFDPVYHSNLYHALIAAVARMLGLPAFEAWSYMLPCAKILAVGGAEALAFSLFRSRPLALVAVCAMVVAQFTNTILPYPNTLLKRWLLLLVFAWAVDLLAGDRESRPILGIAGASAVLAQIHALYYVFEVLILAPVVGVWLVCSLARRRSIRSCAVPLAGLLALGLGLPWLWTTETARGQPEWQPPQRAEAKLADASGVGRDAGEATGNWRYRGFRLTGDGELMLDPRPLLDPSSIDLQLIAVLAAALLLLKPRRRVASFAAMVLSALVMLHVSWLCTWLVRAAGSPWIVRRLDAVILESGFVIIPCALGLIALRCGLLDRRYLAQPALVAALLFGLAYARAYGLDSGPFRRASYVRRVAHVAKFEAALSKQRSRSALLARYLEPQALVATSYELSVVLPELYDCVPLALPRSKGGRGVQDMDARRRAMERIVSPRTSNVLRLALLRRYRVRYAYLEPTLASRELQQKMRPYTVEASRSRAGLLLELRPWRVE